MYRNSYSEKLTFLVYDNDFANVSNAKFLLKAKRISYIPLCNKFFRSSNGLVVSGVKVFEQYNESQLLVIRLESISCRILGSSLI